MANLNVSIPASSVVGRVTMNVRVTGVRRAVWRVRCAMPLVWLAAKVAGLSITIDVDIRG